MPVVVVGRGGALALMPAPVHTCVDGCRRHVPLPGCGLGCGDSYWCQLGSSCQGSWVTESCDRLSDLGIPTQGLSPAALTLVPPVAFVCGLGFRVQGRGMPGEKVGMGTTEPQRRWHLFVPPGGPLCFAFFPSCLPELS